MHSTMRRSVARSSACHRLRLVALAALLLFLPGCAVFQQAREQAWLSPAQPEQALERQAFALPPGDDVIGQMAVVKLARGDTLPDIARHFSLGINAISAANPGVDLWVPAAGERVLLPLSFILPDAPRAGIIVNLATMRLFQFRQQGASLQVTTYPVGVGTRERPTPTGQMYVERKATRPTWHVPASIAEDHRKKGDPLPAAVPPGPDNPLGEYALYLSKPSYLIHGTNKPASIGLKATNGCLRLYPESVQRLFNDTPVNTPVAIVSQPYLVGQRHGVLYLEAHKPMDGPGTAELEAVKARLRGFEKQAGRPLDWDRVGTVLAEARGIPVAILAMQPGASLTTAAPLKVARPERLFGQPQIPELKLEAWYVLAADVGDEREARRLAAIINHPGPPIPARVLAKSNRYRVIAGPFDAAAAARQAARRLKIDLDLDGILIEPVNKS